MNYLAIAGFLILLSSCQTTHFLEMEYGIGVRNDGVLDTRAIVVKVAGQEFSYGGVEPGNFALNGSGFYLKEGKQYPPIIFHYGLMDEYPMERIIKIPWKGVPKGFQPPGMYPALLIVIYPGVDGKIPQVVWNGDEAVSQTKTPAKSF